MGVRLVIVATCLLVLLFFVGPPAVQANDAPYCSATTHLCECRTIVNALGGSTYTACCQNTLIGEAIGYNICTAAEDLLTVAPGKIKSAACPQGTGQPWTCMKDFPDFCCKPNTINLAGDCAGLAMNKPCPDIVAEARSKRLYFSRNVCGSFDWRVIPGTNVCLQQAPSPWQAINTCSNGSIGVDTAIGCVPTANLKDFLAWILNYAFFASGGVILLMVISTGYTLITSQGNPEKLQAAKENIVSLLSGLILIAFSFILLQAIGADILNLPTFK